MQTIFDPATKAQAFTNARIKYYPAPDGTLKLWSVTCFPEAIFKKAGFEEISDNFRKFAENLPENEEKTGNDEENARKSFGRAKNKLFDLLMCNTDCDFFCTLTFDGEKINRFSYADIIRKLSTLLDNSVRRKGLKYILVPEFHKNGAVHFHGLMNAECLGLSEAVSPHTGRNLKTKGKQIYNIDGFRWGFSTAIRIGEADSEREAVAKYVYKYITKLDKFTKSTGHKVGGRYYLSGGDLRRPQFRCVNVNYFDVPGEPLKLSFGGECKIFKANGAKEPDLTFLGV